MIGVVGFTVASLACGLAIDGTSLAVARLAQGAAAAIMAAQGIALIQLLCARTERIGCLAAFGVIGDLAAISQPVLGGLRMASGHVATAVALLAALPAVVGGAGSGIDCYSLLAVGATLSIMIAFVVAAAIIFADLVAIAVLLSRLPDQLFER